MREDRDDERWKKLSCDDDEGPRISLRRSNSCRRENISTHLLVGDSSEQRDCVVLGCKANDQRKLIER